MQLIRPDSCFARAASMPIKAKAAGSPPAGDEQSGRSKSAAAPEPPTKAYVA